MRSIRQFILIVFLIGLTLVPETAMAARTFSFNDNIAVISQVCRDGISIIAGNTISANGTNTGEGNKIVFTVAYAGGEFGPETLTMEHHPDTPLEYDPLLPEIYVYTKGQMRWDNTLVIGTQIRVSARRDSVNYPEASDTFVVTDCSLQQEIPSNFTYQGQLLDGGNPANNQYSFRLRLYDAETGGRQIGDVYSADDINVTNGQFAVTPTFGTDAFDGNPKWMEIAVKPNTANASEFTTLSPRQQIIAVPYSLQALNTPEHTHLGEHWFGNWPLIIQGSFHSRDFTQMTPYQENSLSNFGLVINNAHDRGSGAIIAAAGQSSLFTYNYSAPSTDGLVRPALYGLSENGEGGVFVTRNGYTILAGYHLSPSGYIQRFYFDWAGNLYIDGNLFSSSTYRSEAGDFAEMLPARTGVEAGDVLVIGDDGELTQATKANVTNVAGVYSSEPAFIGGYTMPRKAATATTAAAGPQGVGTGATLSAEQRDALALADELAANAGKIPLAITGVVSVKVSAENGPIVPGDLLTTSSTPGHAMKATAVDIGGILIHRPGTIIGKALDGLPDGTGMIRVLIALQ